MCCFSLSLLACLLSSCGLTYTEERQKENKGTLGSRLERLSEEFGRHVAASHLVPLSPSVSPSVSTTLDPQRLGSGKETHLHETRDASKQRARRVPRISRSLARTDEGTSGTEWPCSTNREEGITLEPFHQRMAREETSIRTKATATATTRIKPTRCCCPVLSWRHRSSAVRADID